MVKHRFSSCLRGFALALLLAGTNAWLNAQNTDTKDWRKLHYLSEEEMRSGDRSSIYQETDPPAGDYVRFPAEFEPMQAVTIRYPLGIPTNLVKQLSERTKVFCIVTSNQQSSARSTFQNAGCNMDSITFYNMSTDSYWVRDYAPWYIFNDLEPAIVDNAYNRPRQNDNMVPHYMGQQLGLTVYGMNLTHTGGNMMEDGRGVGVSDELVLNENNNDETNVRNKMRSYLGIDPYHITIDPQGDYIAHVDCWGKLLAPDKILIAQLPASNSHYADYESVANFFATTNCCWGYPYKVYRVYEPGGNTVAPYTNSLIINKTVFVPMGSNTTYNNQALAVYQEALPGYEIIGVTGASTTPWENTDALHCRTRGVMDFNMLFVDHRDVVFGEQPMQDSIAITSKFIAYSGRDLVADSLLVYYRIDGGDYQVAHMTATGNADEYVGYIKGYTYGSSVDYYVFGKDLSGHRYAQPSFGALEPHHFQMEEAPAAQQDVSLVEGWNWWAPTVQTTVDALTAALGTCFVDIVAQDGTAPTTLEVGEMYKVAVTADCSAVLGGTSPASVTVDVDDSPKWFGCLTATAIGRLGITPADGDKVVAQDEGFAIYEDGVWNGTLNTLQPGHGYVYVSNSATPRTMVLDTGR